MSLRKFIIILPFLCGAIDARAQVPEAPSSVPQQWQLTLDGIKAKAQGLMVENSGLKVEYRQLTAQVQRLQQSIEDQQYKNDQMDRLLKERHGRTDQQVRIEELKQGIKTKKQGVRILEEHLGSLQKKQSGLDRKIQLLNDKVSGMDLHPQPAREKVQPVENAAGPQVDDQLSELRKQLEDENKQEVLLGNELEALKSGNKMQNVNGDDIEAQNKQLEAHLDILRLRKLQHEKKSSDLQLAQANEHMYENLKLRKEQLEANINAYETRLDELRESSLMALSWPLKKKKLVHELVQTDARNNQVRNKIKDLHEDIDVLKDQVARLERRVDFVQDKSTKQ